MKTIFVAVLLVVASSSVMAGTGYFGDCNVLIQTIRSTETWRDNGITLSKINDIIDRDIDKTTIGPVATQAERDQWHVLAFKIFNGKKLNSDQVAKSVGRFCKPPYSVIQDSFQTAVVSVKNDEDKMHICAVNSTMYELAANWRNSNFAPEKALELSESFKEEITLQNRKKIINIVYFDPAFERAGGDALRNQMLHVCLFGPQNWNPLK